MVTPWERIISLPPSGTSRGVSTALMPAFSRSLTASVLCISGPSEHAGAALNAMSMARFTPKHQPAETATLTGIFHALSERHF